MKERKGTSLLTGSRNRKELSSLIKCLQMARRSDSIRITLTKKNTKSLDGFVNVERVKLPVAVVARFLSMNVVVSRNKNSITNVDLV